MLLKFSEFLLAVTYWKRKQKCNICAFFSYGHTCIFNRITFVIIILQLSKSLTPWDVLLSLIAAATHDLDHPGVNQPFLIKTNHYLATLYKVRAKLVALLKPGLENVWGVQFS